VSAAAAAPALRLDGLEVGFGGGAGLLPVSLDVAAGERLVVLGASGAGKTTLLRAVAGLAPARAGRVWVAPRGGAPRDVTALPPERRDAVYLHQTPAPFAHLSVFENVAFPLRLRRVPGAELRRRVGDALALVRLGDYAARMPHQLSGGQRHRVALARAIAARPAVLLLDEPLSSLDPSLRDEVRQAIVRAQEESGPALVLVTHDLDEAGLLAHRAAVLAERRLLQVAPPAELFARPASLAVARFLGVGAEVPGRVGGDGLLRSALGTWPAPGLPPGPAVAVVRPDALRLGGAAEGAAAGGGAAGVVEAVRHRARQTTAAVRLEREGFAPARVEVAAAPSAVPPVGARVAVAADPGAVPVFADA
jgi:ABC-type Fe3+/spermidine/putrescine transport system ATPase subunit